MAFFVVIAFFGVMALFIYLKIKAERALTRGINRAVRHKTVAREKELTGEVIEGRVDSTTVPTILDSLRELLPFAEGKLPLIGGALYVVSVGGAGFKIAYGNRLNNAFEAVVVLEHLDTGGAVVRYTISEWLQVDGVAGATKMMESVREAVILTFTHSNGAQWVKRSKDDVETMLWSSVSSGLQVPAVGAILDPDLDDTRLVARPKPTAAQPHGAAVPRLDAGLGRTCDLQDALVIGRDPVPPRARSDAATWSLEDPLMSLSKTHALVERSSAGLLVTDLHSKNGSHYRLGGTHVTLPPGTASEVPSGATLLLGELEIELTA